MCIKYVYSLRYYVIHLFTFQTCIADFLYFACRIMLSSFCMSHYVVFILHVALCCLYFAYRIMLSSFCMSHYVVFNLHVALCCLHFLCRIMLSSFCMSHYVVFIICRIMLSSFCMSHYVVFIFLDSVAEISATSRLFILDFFVKSTLGVCIQGTFIITVTRACPRELSQLNECYAALAKPLGLLYFLPTFHILSPLLTFSHIGGYFFSRNSQNVFFCLGRKFACQKQSMRINITWLSLDDTAQVPRCRDVRLRFN